MYSNMFLYFRYIYNILLLHIKDSRYTLYNMLYLSKIYHEEDKIVSREKFIYIPMEGITLSGGNFSYLPKTEFWLPECRAK